MTVTNIVGPLCGEVIVPSDKSLVHRAVLLASIAEGQSLVRTNAIGRDNLASIRVMQQLGVSISCRLSAAVLKMAEEEGIANISRVSGIEDGGDSPICELEIEGQGLKGLREPKETLNCGNSGTTARLLLGVLAAAQIKAQIDGDASLRKRPFKRVTEPLGRMGAVFDGESLPLRIESGVKQGIHYYSPKASAQVKSALLLAGLGLKTEGSQSEVSVVEPVLSRDHTEKMLTLMGCPVLTKRHSDWSFEATLSPNVGMRVLKGLNLEVAGDFSAASFVLALGSLAPGSDILVKGVGFNATRTGFYELLKCMGGNIEVLNPRVISGEDIVDLRVKSSSLHGVQVSREAVVYAIDEVPILAICAAFASGETTIRGAEELRVKESDRLSLMTAMLQRAGFQVEEFGDGMRIVGNPSLIGHHSPVVYEGVVHEDAGSFEGKGDHRIALCASILDYLLTGSLRVVDEKETETSFPGFGNALSGIMVGNL